MDGEAVFRGSACARRDADLVVDYARKMPHLPSFGAFAMCYDLELSMTNADSAAEWFDALGS